MLNTIGRLFSVGVLFVALSGVGQAQSWSSLRGGEGYAFGGKEIRKAGDPQPASKVLEVANSFRGIPYVWAGKSPKSGFDCSGFIYEVMRLNGYTVPRLADHQFAESTPVKYDQLQPGDMVFFSTYLPGASHCGFYLGRGEFLHASSAGKAVIVSQMRTGYYRQRFVGGGRPANWEG